MQDVMPSRSLSYPTVSTGKSRTASVSPTPQRSSVWKQKLTSRLSISAPLLAVVFGEYSAYRIMSPPSTVIPPAFAMLPQWRLSKPRPWTYRPRPCEDLLHVSLVDNKTTNLRFTATNRCGVWIRLKKYVKCYKIHLKRQWCSQAYTASII